MADIKVRDAALVSLLQAVISYDSASGDLRWRQDMGRGGNVPAGSICSCVTKSGYAVVTYKGRQYKAHHVAWALHYGSWPTALLDHKDGDKANNSIENLREANVRLNNQNFRRAHQRSESGLLGVFRARAGWGARICADRRRIWLGVFATPELAHQAYLQAKRSLHEGNTL